VTFHECGPEPAAVLRGLVHKTDELTVESMIDDAEVAGRIGAASASSSYAPLHPAIRLRLTAQSDAPRVRSQSRVEKSTAELQDRIPDIDARAALSVLAGIIQRANLWQRTHRRAVADREIDPDGWSAEGPGAVPEVDEACDGVVFHVSLLIARSPAAHAAIPSTARHVRCSSKNLAPTTDRITAALVLAINPTVPTRTPWR
jgi:hypothetical protein